MDQTKKNARIAGFLYLLLGVVAPLRLMYIPNKLLVSGDATATANNILAHQTLFRLGILADVLTGTIVIFVTFALYRLFKEVNRNLAVMIIVFGSLMVTPIYFINTLNDAATLQLVRGANFLSVFDQAQRNALAMLFLRLHFQGVVVNQIFWGLWLFPFGMLVYKSRFLPRVLGVWLIINGIAYVVISFTGLMFPHRYNAVFNGAMPALLGEPAIMLWLVIMGAKERPLAAAAA
ncbi:MAG: DUF4386 domain-containing protein [Acidobacteriales bacterium]|nr:DUF4386 domain-containing protein [Terriglobales bacterium]